LARNPDDDVRIHYLPGPGISAEDESRLAGMVERAGGSISFMRVTDEMLAGLPTEGFTRKATWYRIFLPELLPNVDRLLFLDLDLIVMDSLRPLWEIDLRGRYVAAVTNVPPSRYARRLGAAGFDPGDYFNAGVVLMDLKVMRRDGCTEAMREYGVTHSDQLVLRDQDALNAVLGHSRLPLHPRWNCMNSFFEFPWSNEVFGADALERAKVDPAIRHFEGRGKPWHYLCDHNSSSLYADHRKQTPWPRFRVEGATPINMLRRVRRRLRGKAGPPTFQNRLWSRLDRNPSEIDRTE
jgi:lipopolysaccharide biosynthesis glycosyltransferase